MSRSHLIAAATAAAFLLTSGGAAFGADAKKCQLTQFGSLPVTMSGTRPIISGTINGKPARFLADSGAAFSMMSYAAAEKYNLAVGPLPQRMTVRGIGGTARAGVAKAKTFSLAGFVGGKTYEDVEFVVTGGPGREVDGIIGQNVLGNLDTEFDLANGVIRVFKSKDCKGSAVAYWEHSTTLAEMKIEPTNALYAHLIGDAKINGKKIRAMFDTGASTSILRTATAAKVGVTPDDDEVTASGVSFGIGKKTPESYLARFETFEIGGELIKNARIRIGEIEIASHADMLLGADFFLSHRVYVANDQNRLYFTYNGGPVFDLRPIRAPRPTQTAGTADSPAPDAAAVAPTAAMQTAADTASSNISGGNQEVLALRRKAAASAGRGDYAAAVTDLNEAVKLDSNDAENFYERGDAYYRSGRPVLAFADFEQALTLKPDHTRALLARGTMYLGRKNESAAHTDFTKAEQLNVGDPETALRIARIYSNARHYSEAIERLNRFIDANPKDGRLPLALHDRCRARAISGTELDLAVADCVSALKKGPTNSVFLDSRAFAYLRNGNLDKAIEDYKAVLKLQPKQANSLYGLGIAEIKKGLKTEGDQHVNAAVALQANVGEFYKNAGLAP